MNTLFAKILLWFGITLAVMFVGLSVVTALQWRDAPQRSGFAEFHMKQALSALETGGKEGLQEYLKSLGNATNNDVFLLDTGNRDLVTGEVREVPEMRSRRSGPRLFPYFSSGPPRARIIQQGNFRMLMIFREDPGIVWWLTPQSFWILGAAILLCFILAAYLSSPLRAMQRVVEQYGEGKLDLRIRSRRKDEFGKLARAFDQMADRIQTLLGAERRLLADISHELRSPLARLSVATELLEDPEEREIARAQIRRETERLNQLIGGLLEVTRAEGDPSHLRHDTVNLHSLFLDIVHDCSFEARERQVEIRYATEKEWRVEGDPELLRRAVENALRNALRYAPSGSAVSLDCKSSDEGLLIEVRDFGPGVPEEELERIFDPFFRVENDRNRCQGGAGLGLSIARRAVELHGGHIRARNGRPGLLVQIRLPLSVAAPAIV